MMTPLTFTLAQINPVVGDIRGNVEKIKSIWKDANSDIVIFPELFLCGYPPDDLVLKPLFLDSIQNAVEKLVQDSVNYSAHALLSVPWRDGEKIYSALHVVGNGKIHHTQYKVHLPNYGVFDEERLFENGPLPHAFSFKGHKLGLLICEDLWYPDVTEHLKNQGAELLISPNASPFSSKNVLQRAVTARMRVMETGLPLIYVNQWGGQDELVFDGTSFVMHPDGNYALRLPSFEETIIDISYPVSGHCAAADKPTEDILYKAIVTGLHDYVTKNRFPGVVLGMSGGIDSALTAAMAVDALGADKVRLVMLPSPYTSAESMEDAKACAKELGCRYEVISIETAMGAFEHSIPGLKDIAHQNMQSRTRGLILMALSNMTGDMVLSTGNKSEMAVGYATIYGDMNGGFNPLKDLYKTQVYRLAKWRNSVSHVIPDRIITRAPSAELKPNQTDQDSLPPYEELDSILYALIEEDAGMNDIISRGFAKETVLKVWNMLDKAEYKRRQACPGVKITGKAFGRDRRYPITNRFFDNIEKA